MVLCSHCGAENEPGSFYCRECGTELIPQGTTEPTQAPVPPVFSDAPSPELKCPKCGVLNSIQDAYCRGCGAKLDYSSETKSSDYVPTAAGQDEAKRNTAYFGSSQQAVKARLVLIKGDGAEGMSFSIRAEKTLAGRKTGEILFPEDEYLSNPHAEFYFDEDGRFYVRDLDSTNGVYKKVDHKVLLDDGDHFLVGEQVFRFRRFEEPPLLNGTNEPLDGTKYQGTAVTEVGPFCVEQILRGGQIGIVYFPKVGEMTIGREDCDLNFPEDMHLSRTHAKLYMHEDSIVLEDLDSRNGTFVKIHAESPLKTNDLIFLGSQLLRVELTN